MAHNLPYLSACKSHATAGGEVEPNTVLFTIVVVATAILGFLADIVQLPLPPVVNPFAFWGALGVVGMGVHAWLLFDMADSHPNPTYTGRSGIIKIWVAQLVVSVLLVVGFHLLFATVTRAPNIPESTRNIALRFSLIGIYGAVLGYYTWAEITESYPSRQAIRREFRQTVSDAFAAHTLPEIGRLQRDEVGQINSHLTNNDAVVVTGPAGVGKSGIIAAVANDWSNPALFIDPTSLPGISGEEDLRNELGLPAEVRECLNALAHEGPLLLVVDQVDTVQKTEKGDLLNTLIQDTIDIPYVKVVFASQGYEYENRAAFQPYRQDDLTRVSVDPLEREEIRSLLNELGIESPPERLLTIARNLHNLKLIANIASNSDRDWQSIQTEVELWKAFLDEILYQESSGGETDETAAEELPIKTADLARQALENRGSIRIEGPLDRWIQLLLAWDILEHEEGYYYRFTHERFEEFFFAYDAANEQQGFGTVKEQLDSRQLQSICVLMVGIYLERESSETASFLSEALADESTDIFAKLQILREITLRDPDTVEDDIVETMVEALTDEPALERQFFRMLIERLDDRESQSSTIAEVVTAWAAPLFDHGAFESLTEPKLRYLDRVAHAHPDVICAILESMEGANLWAINKMLMVASGLPPSSMHRAYDILTEFEVFSSDGPPPKNIVYLIEEWAKRGGASVAIDLLLYTRTAVSARRRHDFEDRLARDGSWMSNLGSALEVLAQIAPRDAAATFREILSAEFADGEDQSVWGLNIQYPLDSHLDWGDPVSAFSIPNERGYHDYYAYAFVIGLREALIQAVGDSSESSEIGDFLREYLESSSVLYQRLALYSLSQAPNAVPRLVTEALTTARWYESNDYYPELRLLWMNRFPDLSSEAQDEVIGFVEQDLSNILTESDVPFDDIDDLLTTLEDVITPVAPERYRSFADNCPEFGLSLEKTDENPEERLPTADELEAEDDLLNVCQRTHDNIKALASGSDSATADELQETFADRLASAVAARIDQNAERLAQFSEVDPGYLAAIIFTLEERLRQKEKSAESIPWDVLLPFFERVCTDVDEWPETCRYHIVRLIVFQLHIDSEWPSDAHKSSLLQVMETASASAGAADDFDYRWRESPRSHNGRVYELPSPKTEISRPRWRPDSAEIGYAYCPHDNTQSWCLIGLATLFPRADSEEQSRIARIVQTRLTNKDGDPLSDEHSQFYLLGKLLPYFGGGNATLTREEILSPLERADTSIQVVLTRGLVQSEVPELLFVNASDQATDLTDLYQHLDSLFRTFSTELLEAGLEEDETDEPFQRMVALLMYAVGAGAFELPPADGPVLHLFEEVDRLERDSDMFFLTSYVDLLAHDTLRSPSIRDQVMGWWQWYSDRFGVGSYHDGLSPYTGFLMWARREDDITLSETNQLLQKCLPGALGSYQDWCAFESLLADSVGVEPALTIDIYYQAVFSDAVENREPKSAMAIFGGSGYGRLCAQEILEQAITEDSELEGRAREVADRLSKYGESDIRSLFM